MSSFNDRPVARTPILLTSHAENTNLRALFQNNVDGNQENNDEVVEDLIEYRNGEPRANAPWTPSQRARTNAALAIADIQIKKSKCRVQKQFACNYKKLVRKVKREISRRSPQERTLREQGKHLRQVASLAIQLVDREADQKLFQERAAVIKRNFAQGYIIASLKARKYRLEQNSDLPEGHKVLKSIEIDETGNTKYGLRSRTKIRLILKGAVGQEMYPAELPRLPDPLTYPIIKEESV